MKSIWCCLYSYIGSGDAAERTALYEAMRNNSHDFGGAMLMKIEIIAATLICHIVICISSLWNKYRHFTRWPACWWFLYQGAFDHAIFENSNGHLLYFPAEMMIIWGFIERSILINGWSRTASHFAMISAVNFGPSSFCNIMAASSFWFAFKSTA